MAPFGNVLSFNSTIPREPSPASFIFKVQCPICIVVLQKKLCADDKKTLAFDLRLLYNANVAR
jgi:hypothetical protein